MCGQPINHVLAQKSLALMFGDLLPLFMAAKKRVGNEVTAFLFFQLGRHVDACTETLAGLWAAELDHPIDYGMIELFVAMQKRMSSSPFLVWRVGRTMRKAGIYPSA